MASGRAPLTLPNLLLCEGPDDVAFFQSLISFHGLPHFCVRDTSTERGGAGGNTKFGLALKALQLDFKVVKRILVVADNDDDPQGRFEFLKSQLSQVFAAEKLPNAPLNTSAVTDKIDLTILMIPATEQHGNLETLCRDAAQRANVHVADRIDAFSADTVPPEWESDIRRSEMWLRCNLAVRCRQDPFVYLGTAFRDYPDLIPLNDKAFRPIVDLLRGFT